MPWWHVTETERTEMERKRTELEFDVLRATLSRLDELRGPGFLIEAVAEQDRTGRITRQICAKVSPELVEQVDGVTSVLGLSKRRFIEAALVDAVQRAHAIMADEGLFDALDEANARRPREAA